MIKVIKISFNKIRTLTFKKNYFYLFQWKHFKSDEKCFLFHVKARFVLEIFTLLSWLFGHVKDGLIRKLWLISKFMTSQAGQQIITIHQLRNISRSKGNCTRNVGQLIEYNIRNILLEKSYTKWVGEASPRPFHKKSKLSISLERLHQIL